MKERILFELEENKTRCKHCKNFLILKYPSGRRFFYCKRKKSNRTDNGLEKIKANDYGCRKYKEKK